MRAALVALCLIAASCGREPARTEHRAESTPQPTPEPGRVAVIVMENKELGTILGNPAAPYTNALAGRSALATSFYAITHPSLPNYLAMLGGDTFEIKSNCTDCHIAAPSLVDQLEDAGISWKAYVEGLPEPCWPGPHKGRYVRWHNPFFYFDRVANDPARCGKVAPLTELTQDTRAGTLPLFVWITPDNCHNSHECDIATGDRFLSELLPPLLDALGPRGVLILTYDEGETPFGCCSVATGGRIVTIVAGPGASPGRYDDPLTHYSLLRAVEDRFGLPRLGRAASPGTPSMDELLKPL